MSTITRTRGGYFRSRHLARADISALGPKGLNLAQNSHKFMVEGQFSSPVQ